MIKRLAFQTIIATSVLATDAIAAPVYLECTLSPMVWRLTIDEEQGTVKWSVLASDGEERTGSADAQFTPTTVRYRYLSAAFEVSRTTLSFHQRVEGGINKDGTCKRAAVPRRAF